MNKNKNQENILHNFKKASIEMVEVFAKKQELECDYHISDNPASAVSFNGEMVFSLDEIWHDLATNQPKRLIIEWHNQTMKQVLNEKKYYINYFSWTKGKRYDN